MDCTCRKCGASYESERPSWVCLACRRASHAAWARRYRAGATSKECRRCKGTFTNQKWKQLCDPCRKTAKRENARASSRAHRSANRARLNAEARLRGQAARTGCYAGEIRDRKGAWLRRTQLEVYGAPADYDALVQRQKGVCAICLKACRRGRRLAIDHDHESGLFRGLLCGSCNWALGLFRDDPEVLERAAAYVRRGPAGSACNLSSDKEIQPCPTA